MPLDGLGAQVQLIGQSRVGESSCHQGEHLPLALGEPVEGVLAATPGDEPAHELGVDDDVAAFTDRRLQIWNRTLDPKTYQVRALGDTWAVARESTAGSPFWVVSRYDWSDPTMIRTTVEESSWGGSGTGSVRIAPANSGGSRVHAEWTHTGMTRTRDKVLLSLINSFPIRRMIARLWVKALDGYAQSDLA